MKECQVCKRQLDLDKFYRSKSSIHQDGRIDVCKDCVSFLLKKDDSFAMWVLKECNIPFIYQEWKNLCDRYPDIAKENPIGILGRYLSKMNLKGFVAYTWEDSKDLLQFYLEHIANRGWKIMEDTNGHCK